MNKKFWKHYRIFMIISFILIIAILSFLWIYLFAYEKSMPEYTAEKVVNFYQKNKTNKIVKYIKLEDKYITKDAITKYFKNTLKDVNIEFQKKSGVFKKEYPVYSILSNNKEIAVISLKKSKDKGMFNTTKWEIEEIKQDFKKDKVTIITLPDEIIDIEGIKVTQDELVDNNYYLESLNNVLKYVDLKPMVKYEIDNILITSDVNFAKYKHNRSEDNIYLYDFPSDNELLESKKEFLTNWCKNYTKYVVNEANFGSISGSVVTNSNAYSFLKTVANTNKWLAEHTSTEFSEFTFKNMHMYADDLFSIDIEYEYSFYVNEDLKKYTTNLTLYLIEVNGNWLIADLTT